MKDVIVPEYKRQIPVDPVEVDYVIIEIFFITLFLGLVKNDFKC